MSTISEFCNLQSIVLRGNTFIRSSLRENFYSSLQVIRTLSVSYHSFFYSNVSLYFDANPSRVMYDIPKRAITLRGLNQNLPTAPQQEKSSRCSRTSVLRADDSGDKDRKNTIGSGKRNGHWVCA